MKGIPFKDGLEKIQQEWRKQEWDRLQEEERKKPIVEPEPVPRRIVRAPEKVLNSTVNWKPVDRVAARMIYKSPWWARPITKIEDIRKEEVEQPIKKNKIRKHKIMDGDSMVAVDRPFGYQDNGAVKTQIINGEVHINLADIAVKVLERINKHPQQLTPLARAATDASNVLNESMAGLGGVLEDFQSKSKIMLEDIRQTRFSMVNEVNHMNKEIKELRQFFLGSDYKEEISRLKEFVELCERLEKLKKSGMLDAIGDTMIRLSVNEK